MMLATVSCSKSGHPHWCTAMSCCLRSQPHVQWPLARTLSHGRMDLQARPLLKALGAREGAVLRLFDNGAGGLVASLTGPQVRPSLSAMPLIASPC